jgi:hypothetical protein
MASYGTDALETLPPGRLPIEGQLPQGFSRTGLQGNEQDAVDVADTHRAHTPSDS